VTELPSSPNGDALEVAIAAARAAGADLMERRGRSVSVSRKGRANITTDADLAAEQIIVERISRAFPDHAILAEESGNTGAGAEFQWVVDPLDGTFNYSLGIPLFAVSIALVRHGKPLAGVVFDPANDELFAAGTGRGATLNGEPIAVESGRTFREAVIGYDLGYHDGRARRAIETEMLLWGHVQLFRCLGSAALGCAYAAAGRFDVYFHHFVSPWDFAAGWLLITEAGGIAVELGRTPLSLQSNTLVAGHRDQVMTFLTATAELGALPD
jgi:myo-inositol-1(or 4)-monophosphatase